MVAVVGIDPELELLELLELELELEELLELELEELELDELLVVPEPSQFAAVTPGPAISM